MLNFDFHEIGNKLFTIRKRAGMTQAEVAEAAGLSDRTYADIERGTVNMRIETVLRICTVLHITPDEILAYGDSENDRELLSWVGTAVTMYGAKYDLFSITRYHTQNVAESVLRFLRDEDAAQNRRGRTHG